MVSRRTFLSLVAGSMSAPRVAFAQPDTRNVALYANVGADLTQYDVDVAGAVLTKRATVTLPAGVQYAWPHVSRRYLYVATSSSASGYGPAGTEHHVTAFRIDPASGALTKHGEPIRLPTRPIHMSTDIPSENILVEPRVEYRPITSIPCERNMLRATILFAVGLCANVLIGLPAMAQAPAEVTLTRIECGTGATPTDVGQRFTDTFAYKDLKLTFTFSCYLIKHGDEYMVWDTGFAPGTNPNAPKVGIADRLKELKVTPEQVKYVGISHFHGDHTGQLAPFTNATLLIGKGDWDGITAPTPMQGANVAGFKSWIDERRKVEPLTADKDVFGDGSVIVLRTPGHTPGHSCLLVRLKEMGPLLLSGDAAHFRENYESGGVPSFNFDRAATVASIERMKQIAANLKATVVIQHDMRDIGKLPAFPAAAK